MVYATPVVWTRQGGMKSAMPSLRGILLALAFSLAASGAALPGATSSAPASAPPPAKTTPAPPVSASMPATCDYSYCDGTSSWCFYWGGVTSWDVNRGPVPGEIRAPLGPCAPPRRSPATTTINTTTTPAPLEHTRAA